MYGEAHVFIYFPSMKIRLILWMCHCGTFAGYDTLLTHYVARHMLTHNAKIAYGGFSDFLPL